jgi:hypothetical protein
MEEVSTTKKNLSIWALDQMREDHPQKALADQAAEA